MTVKKIRLLATSSPIRALLSCETSWNHWPLQGFDLKTQNCHVQCTTEEHEGRKYSSACGFPDIFGGPSIDILIWKLKFVLNVCPFFHYKPLGRTLGPGHGERLYVPVKGGNPRRRRTAPKGFLWDIPWTCIKHELIQSALKKAQMSCIKSLNPSFQFWILVVLIWLGKKFTGVLVNFSQDSFSEVEIPSTFKPMQVQGEKASQTVQLLWRWWLVYHQFHANRLLRDLQRWGNSQFFLWSTQIHQHKEWDFQKQCRIPYLQNVSTYNKQWSNFHGILFDPFGDSSQTPLVAPKVVADVDLAVKSDDLADSDSPNWPFKRNSTLASYHITSSQWNHFHSRFQQWKNEINSCLQPLTSHGDIWATSHSFSYLAASPNRIPRHQSLFCEAAFHKHCC